MFVCADVVRDLTAVAIAVPIIIIFFVIVVVVIVIVIVGFSRSQHLKQNKKMLFIKVRG